MDASHWPTFPFRPFIPPLLILVLVGCAGQPQAPSVEPTARPNASAASMNSAGETEPALPEAPILFQPQFLWDDATVTREGTGFFAKTAGGQIAAVSSVQYLRGDRPTLREATWLTVTTDEPVVTFTRHWGEPGQGGSLAPTDLRDDYLLLPAKQHRVPAKAPLELDPRASPNRNERVWLPVKDIDAANGYRAVKGKVISNQTKKFIVVDLQQQLPLESLNGSPVISQQTGKVVGVLSRGGRLGENTFLILTPVSALRQAIADAEQTIPLTKAFAATPRLPSDNAG